MTPLRRARREVYRVYSEEEFLALTAEEPRSSSHELERVESSRREHGGPVVRGGVVPTASVIAIGAAGGFVALLIATSFPGARHGGRTGVVSAARSLAYRRLVHARRQRRRSTASSSHSLRTPRDRRVAHIHASIVRQDAAPRETLARRVGSNGMRFVSVSSGAATRPAVSGSYADTSKDSPASPPAERSSRAQSPQSEFGFER